MLHGYADEGFGGVADALRAGLDRAGGVGLACCVHHRGRVVVDMWGGVADPATGRRYTSDTLQILHTATTGALVACAGLLVERGELDLDAPVAAYWPEFASHGKEGISLRCVLSHQAGLAALDASLAPSDVLAVEPVIDAIARQAPRWPPGTAHGYHAVTAGWLVGEVIRRRTGRTVGAFFADEIARPLGLEFWIGLPGSYEWRVAPLLGAPRRAPAASLSDGGGRSHWDARRTGVATVAEPLTWATATLDGALTDHTVLNSRALHATEVPALNGIATARSLSKMYAAFVDGGTARLLSRRTVELFNREAVDGLDLVLGGRTRFGLGFSLATPDWPLLGRASFGSIGIGNAVGFADGAYEVGFGFVSNRAGNGGRPDDRTASLIEATRRCLAA